MPARAGRSKGGPTRTYEVRAKFRAPVDFVYRWCTDYTTDDARYESENYRRRILRRSSRQVVYEDLEETSAGWRWTRHVVRLLPPDRWHSESVGSHRQISLDYRLSALKGGRTLLVLTARRRPYGVGGKNPSRSQWVREIGRSWVLFGRALERDYRKALRKRARGRKRSSGRPRPK